MSLGSIPPVEGRVLEGCDPVTHALSGGLFEAAEGCLYLYPTFIFTFSLCPCAMRGNHQHILVQGGKCRKMVLFPQEPGGPCRLHTWSVLLQGSEDVVAFLACWGRIAVWEPLEGCSAPICKQARGTGVEWFAFFSDTQGMGITSYYGISERATRYKVTS